MDEPLPRPDRCDDHPPTVTPEGENQVLVRPIPRSFRFLKAYATTFRVIGAYLWLRLKSRFLGRDYFERRVRLVHVRSAQRVARTLLSLQGLFIKVGQLISVMTNFLPEEFRKGLEQLQDRVPARPYTQVARRIREELGADPHERFARFDERPIASASLGQVHRATTKDGRDVAVKVQHVGIGEVVRKDLRTIRRILSIVHRFFPVENLDEYHRQIREMVQAELDFTLEADHIRLIARNFRDEPTVHFPEVVPELSTRAVLTTTFCEGVNVAHVEELDRLCVDRKKLARLLITSYCQMIFVDGVYHADPHPGNILVRADGSITFLDFGAIGTLSPSMREGIPEFLEGVIRRNTAQILGALRKMGFISVAADEVVAERIIEYFHKRLQEEVHIDSLNLKDVKFDPNQVFRNLADLSGLGVSLRDLTGAFQIPRDWVLLERTLLLLMGICTTLDPETRPMEIIYPYVREYVFGPERDWTQIFVESIKDTALSYLTLPDQVQKFVQRSLKGQLEVQVRGLAPVLDRTARGVRQLTYALLGAGAWLGFLYFDHAGNPVWRERCLWAAGAALVLIAGSILAGRRNARRR
ncbi:MAG: AarF/ABC1/UbiB kinase family protein [Deltaproteobacteria bacterium]|nr:AarF/ABC1/UbiB kinase family protein [Deltaproteobacteria bacterium]